MDEKKQNSTARNWVNYCLAATLGLESLSFFNQCEISFSDINLENSHPHNELYRPNQYREIVSTVSSGSAVGVISYIPG